MDNLALWKSVEKTDPNHTKPITGKSYKGDSPKPHFLIYKATEKFGPCGIGWGFTVDERIEQGALLENGSFEKMHIAKVMLWYILDGKRGEVEHIGGTPFSGVRLSGKPYTDEDAPKKSVTDALVKCLSMIGFAGDIFMGRYDDSKYVSELRQEVEQEAANASKANARPVYTALKAQLEGLPSEQSIREWYASDSTKEMRAQLPHDWHKTFASEVGEAIKAINETPFDEVKEPA